MFKYLYKGEYHTDTSNAYMKKLGLDSEVIESILNQKEFELEDLSKKARTLRDTMIRVTDFYLMPDYDNVPEGMAEYRQALRDVPQQVGFPFDIEWPVL